MVAVATLSDPSVRPATDGSDGSKPYICEHVREDQVIDDPVDWTGFCVELLKRLDRIADELQHIGDRIAETTTTKDDV